MWLAVEDEQHRSRIEAFEAHVNGLAVERDGAIGRVEIERLVAEANLKHEQTGKRRPKDSAGLVGVPGHRCIGCGVGGRGRTLRPASCL